MKKLAILLVMLLATVNSFGQEKNEWEALREKKSEKFAELAAKEFELTKGQEKELYERKLEHFKEQETIKKQIKQGKELTKDQKKKPNRSFGAYFSKLTGNSYENLKPFYVKANQEMKRIK